MFLFPRKLTAAALVSLSALAPAAHAATVYSLASGGGSLIRFDSSTPGLVTSIGSLSGATPFLDGLDFRPADGMLYGYADSTDSVYRVDVSTGATTLVSTSNQPTSTALLGIDFNPVPDRMRVVTTNGENRRINIGTGATLADGQLTYAPGDVNAGRTPLIIDAAYTNNDNDIATGTTLFYIDYGTNSLVSTTNPNGGVLNTVASLGFDIDEFTGFDIFTMGGINTALASLHVGGIFGLYDVNLATGAASLIGQIGNQQQGGLRGLAVSPVPEPGSLALVAAAGLAAFGVRRRKVTGAQAAT